MLEKILPIHILNNYNSNNNNNISKISNKN